MAKAGISGKIYMLPGFMWDRRAMRYRDLETGRFVARSTIVDLLRNVTDTSAARLEALAAAAVRGEIPAGLFQRAAMAELKALHLSSAALGAGGWDRLGPADFGRVGGILKSEYRYLAGFVRDIEAGKLTEAQAAARARLYAGKGYSEFYSSERAALEKRALSRGKILYARWQTVGDSEVCRDCQALESMGWQPAAMFPVPGDGHTACLGNCRCSLEYQEREA